MANSELLFETGTPNSSGPIRRAARRLRRGWNYARGVRERRALYPGSPTGDPAGSIDYEAVLVAVGRDGYAVVANAVDPAGLESVGRELDAAIEANRLLPVLRGWGSREEPRQLTPDEVRRGDAYMHDRVFIVYVADPFVTCPSSLPYALSCLVERVSRRFYGCPAVLTAGKVMRSYANDLPALELNWFHYDTQARRVLKFFMYLKDVEPGGGAFCYVAGSHRRKPWGLFAPEYLSDDEVREFWGPQAMRELVARRGTVVIADTAGYHRAGKPLLADRDVLLVTTGVHRFPDPLRLPREYVEALDPSLRALADLAELA